MSLLQNSKLIFAVLVILTLLTSAYPSYAAPFVVDDRRDAPDISPGDGFCVAPRNICTLRAAIMETNALAGADTITIGVAGPFNLTRTGTAEDAASYGDLDITDNLTLSGSTAYPRYIIDASAIDERVFHIVGSPSVTIQGATIRNGSDTKGGGIYNTGTLNLKNSFVTINTATSDGGGIYNEGSLNLMYVNVSANTTSSDGGGIYSSGTLDLRKSEISTNTASSEGGGIYSKTGSSLILALGSAVDQNIASGNGGGIYIGEDVTASVNSRSSISSNQSLGYYGGGIYTKSNLTLNTAKISQNQLTNESRAYGGGIYAYSGTTLSLTSSSVKSNSVHATGTTSRASGGGIYSNESVTISASSISDNSVLSPYHSTNGGLWAEAVDISGSKVMGNRVENESPASSTASMAYYGGLGFGDTLNMTGTLVSENSVSSEVYANCGGVGGYIFSTATIADSEITANTVTSSAGHADSGGIEFGYDGTAEIRNTVISKNRVSGATLAHTGGIFSNVDSTLLDTVEVSYNFVTASDGSAWGGGVYTHGENEVEILNSGIYYNEVYGNGDDIGGGGLSLANGLTTKIINSTISHNSISGSADETFGGAGIDASTFHSNKLYFYNTTITENSSGGYGGGFSLFISDDSEFYMQNTLIASNSASDAGQDCYIKGSEKMASMGYNIVGDIDDCNFESTTGDQTGSTSDGTVLDPLLNALADNGGPTMTHSLQEASIALDAGNECETEAGSFDQRGTGYNRTVGTSCDIGAYEVQ